jgi:hypothetical protein
MSLFDRLKDLLGPEAATWVACAILGLAILVVLYILVRILRWRGRERPEPQPALRIDIATLRDEGPPAGPPVLEFYHIPVRLAAVVLAPAGRAQRLPLPNRWPAVLDALLPGLDKVAAQHGPLIRGWPAQLSVQGYAHRFFQEVRLPGDGGKGTPWSSVAGVFKFRGQALMAGLVLRAPQPNSLGQVIIETEHEWLGCLRVKSGS